MMTRRRKVLSSLLASVKTTLALCGPMAASCAGATTETVGHFHRAVSSSQLVPEVVILVASRVMARWFAGGSLTTMMVLLRLRPHHPKDRLSPLPSATMISLVVCGQTARWSVGVMTTVLTRNPLKVLSNLSAQVITTHADCERTAVLSAGNVADTKLTRRPYLPMIRSGRSASANITIAAECCDPIGS